MHGQLLQARCLACSSVSAWPGDLGTEEHCPECDEAGRLRPNVVWFGEMPMHMLEIEDALALADMFVAIGTSGSVYPAAGFVREVRRTGVQTCELNLEPSDNARMFDKQRYGPATVIVPAWVDDLLKSA